MTQFSYPFDDQEVTESEYSALFRELQDTGVTSSGGLTVSADSSGLNVKVSPGDAVVRGHFYSSTGIETLPIAPGEGAARIDTVVLRLDPQANEIVLEVLKGIASTTPAPPALTRTSTGVFDEPLADIAVPANAVTIAASAVTIRKSFTGTRVREWTTALRPTSPRPYQLGYNTTRKAWEFWSGQGWADLVSWATMPGRPTTSTNDGRTIFVSDNAPTASQGANGDLWFEF